VTHYFRHAAWFEENELLEGAERLAGIPGVLIHGRLDASSPLDSAWQLSRLWTGAELVIVDDAGHGTSHPGMRGAVIAATKRFARRR
jgi:proline iminopeptidase